MKIYISYSHFDRFIAEKFCEEFIKNDFEVFWDKEIQLGSNFNDYMLDHLIKADVLFLIISEQSIKSKYVNSEVMTALGYKRIRNSPRIIPYIIGDSSLVPDFLSDISCFMSTGDIDNDAIKLTQRILEAQGSIIAEQYENQESYQSIKINYSIFMEGIMNRLEKNELRSKRIAYFCYVCSGFFIFVATCFSVFKAVTLNTSADFVESIRIITANVISLALIMGLSRMAFMLGKSFMVDSIRNGDRIHAISFGKFFIDAYGDKATRQEVREVFGEWNIDKGSAFHLQDIKELDTQVVGALQIILSALKSK